MASKSIVPPPRVFVILEDGTEVESEVTFGLDADLSGFFGPTEYERKRDNRSNTVNKKT